MKAAMKKNTVSIPPNPIGQGQGVRPVFFSFPFFLVLFDDMAPQGAIEPFEKTFSINDGNKIGDKGFLVGDVRIAANVRR